MKNAANFLLRVKVGTSGLELVAGDWSKGLKVPAFIQRTFFLLSKSIERLLWKNLGLR